MKTILTSMMLSVALSFAMTGCVADATDDTDDTDAIEGFEQVEETEEAITFSGLCMGTEPLPAGYRLRLNTGASDTWSAYGDGSHPASPNCNQYYSSQTQTMCALTYGTNPNPINGSWYPCPWSGGY